jgi:hypothetical protein
MDRIDDTNDDRDDTAIGQVQHLPGAIALAVDQDGVAYPCLGMIDRNEIFVGFFPLTGHRLHNQQPPVIEMRVADGGDNGSDYFSNDHQVFR